MHTNGFVQRIQDRLFDYVRRNGYVVQLRTNSTYSEWGYCQLKTKKPVDVDWTKAWDHFPQNIKDKDDDE